MVVIRLWLVVIRLVGKVHGSNGTIIQMVYLGKMVEQVEMFNKIKSFNLC